MTVLKPKYPRLSSRIFNSYKQDAILYDPDTLCTSTMESKTPKHDLPDLIHYQSETGVIRYYNSLPETIKFINW